LGAGLNEGQLQRIGTDNYFNYWSEFRDVVVVEDDYAHASIASTYASLINAPILIKGFNDSIQLTGKNVICIGSVDFNCNEQYSLQEITQKYAKETGTDKIILINPEDLKIFEQKKATMDRSARAINEIYGKASLSAPSLASAKHELLLSINSTDHADIDKFIETQAKNYGNKFSFLTIMANPNAIPMAKPATTENGCFFAEYIEVDGRGYGDLDNDGLIDLAVGRILGLTSSDSSSLVARSIFLKEIRAPNLDALLVMAGESYSTNPEFLIKFAKYFWTDAVKAKIEKEHEYYGFLSADQNRKEIQAHYRTSSVIIYYDHGSPSAFSKLIGSYNLASEKYYLNSPMIIDVACLTCSYNLRPGFDLFCAQNMRRGAIGFQGAVDVSYWNKEFDETLNGYLLEGKPIGIAYMEARNKDFVDNIYNFCHGIRGDVFYAWIGDPTIELG
jgi:hypothetical protein